MMILKKFKIRATIRWKMSFNPDKSKQVQEVKLSHKTQRVIHPSAIFSNMLVVCSSFQKHLGIYLDEKLNFPNHIKGKISKANKGIGILRKLYNVLPRNSLITSFLTNRKTRVFVKNIHEYLMSIKDFWGLGG